MSYFYLLSYDNELFFEGGRKMDIVAIFDGFANNSEVIKKIWSQSEYVKKFLFEEVDDISHLAYKYPMRRFNIKAFRQNQKYYSRHPTKFLKVLERTTNRSTYNSLRGLVLCSEKNALFKMLNPKCIHKSNDTPHIE
jgi:hypothetical protein